MATLCGPFAVLTMDTAAFYETRVQNFFLSSVQKNTLTGDDWCIYAQQKF